MKNKTHTSPSRVRGFSIIELLVALTIGSVLISGAVYVYSQSSNSYRTNDTVARLQENARYALDVMEPDVRMSSYWGFVNDPELVNGRATTADPTAAVAAGVAANACGNNFSVNLYKTIEGSNESYPFGATCAVQPAGAVVQPNTDTLTVRRVSVTPAAAPVATRLQLWSTRTTARLFSDGITPGALAPVGQIADMIVNTYYVSTRSDNRPTIPSLRRKQLINGPAFGDQEVVTNVEDLQVQLGIDPTGLSGVATRYVNPNAVIPPAAQVVSVRVWVLVRSDAPEVGFRDGLTYRYGSRVYTPNDGFRRVLFSRTIQLRNAMG